MGGARSAISFSADQHYPANWGRAIMSIVLEEKLEISNAFLGESPAGTSSLIRSILLSALLVSTVCGAGIFATRVMGPFEVTETTTATLSAVGAVVCFTSLPFLVALYRKNQPLTLIAASFLVFSMVMLAGVIS